MDEKSQAPALARGLDLLDRVSRSGELSFKELEAQCGYNVSSLNRYLQTLLQTGYVQKNAAGRYELGMRAFQLSLRQSFWTHLTNQVRPALSRLCEELQVTTSLIGYLDNEMTVLDKVVSSNNVMHRRIGEAKSDYLLSPWGYLFLAELEGECRQAFLADVRDRHEPQYDLPDSDELQVIIDRIKKTGYADDRGGVLGRRVRRLAAPIYVEQSLTAALAVSSFSELMDDNAFQRIGRRLVQEANAISEQLR